MEGIRRPTASQDTEGVDQVASASPRNVRGDTPGSTGASTPGGSGNPNISPPSPLLASRGVLKRPSSGGLPVRQKPSAMGWGKIGLHLLLLSTQKISRLHRVSLELKPICFWHVSAMRFVFERCVLGLVVAGRRPSRPGGAVVVLTRGPLKKLPAEQPEEILSKVPRHVTDRLSSVGGAPA